MVGNIRKCVSGVMSCGTSLAFLRWIRATIFYFDKISLEHYHWRTLPTGLGHRNQDVHRVRRYSSVRQSGKLQQHRMILSRVVKPAFQNASIISRSLTQFLRERIAEMVRYMRIYPNSNATHTGFGFASLSPAYKLPK
jgi:hypothetical protein